MDGSFPSYPGGKVSLCLVPTSKTVSSQAMRILLVEDDWQLSLSLQEVLSAHRYAVDSVKDGESAWSQVQVFNYDLVLMDVTLPKRDGLSLCQQLRDYGYHWPILMLTARDTTLDKVRGLDAGADAYMVKPFDLSELLAQIRALLRRSQGRGSLTLRWGELSLDPDSYEVFYGRSSLRLTPKEFALMEALLRCGRRVLSRAALIDQVWHDQELVEEVTIKTYIKTLRAKLKAAGAPRDLIETVHGLGYRLRSH